MFFFSRISGSMNLVTLIVLQACMCLGVSSISTPAQANSLNQLPKQYNAHGVAVLTTAQQIAAAFGSSLFIGLMGVVQTNNLSGIQNPSTAQQHSAMISGAGVAFTAALIIVVIGFIITFFIKPRKEITSDR